MWPRKNSKLLDVEKQKKLLQAGSPLPQLDQLFQFVKASDGAEITDFKPQSY